MATHSSILAGESRGQRSLAGYSAYYHIESDTAEVTEHRQYIKNQRHHFGDKDQHNQSYGLSSSHVWMCRLDPIEN